MGFVHSEGEEWTRPPSIDTTITIYNNSVITNNITFLSTINKSIF